MGTLPSVDFSPCFQPSFSRSAGVEASFFKASFRVEVKKSTALFSFIVGHSIDNIMNNALQLWDGHLSVITRPVPHVQNPQDVVVKITYSAISGTDLKVLEGKFPCEKSVIMGHEFVGVVKEAGSEVKHVSVGDR